MAACYAERWADTAALDVGDLGLEQASLENALRGQEIQPNTAQWVDGSNKALSFRGSELQKSKMWFQRGDPRLVGYTKYYYTGRQKAI